MMRVLFVCVGNICQPHRRGRIPEKMLDRNLGGRVEIDSAGTHGYHVGEAPDKRGPGGCTPEGL